MEEKPRVGKAESVSENDKEQIQGGFTMKQASNLSLLHLNDHNYMSRAFKMDMYLKRDCLAGCM